LARKQHDTAARPNCGSANPDVIKKASSGLGVTVRRVRDPTRGLPRMPLPPNTASYRLMKRIVFPCVFTLIILTTGCGGPKYVPDITLTQTGPIINSIAEFHNLYPAYSLL
jgi:hypothetical protein